MDSHSLPVPSNYGTMGGGSRSDHDEKVHKDHDHEDHDHEDHDHGDHAGCHDSEYSRSFKTDSPVLGLLWLIFSMCLVPAALLSDPTIAILSFVYSIVVSSALAYFQWCRSRAWKVYSIASFALAFLGIWLGCQIQGLEPMNPDRTLNLRAVRICAMVLPSLFACVFLSAHFLHWCDCNIIGSSAAFAERFGWGWETNAVPHMHFGFGYHSGQEVNHKGKYPGRVVSDLMQHRAFWSGEPAFDYWFWTVNEHLYLSCILSHPGHPFSKLERTLVMLLNALLAVFPVAAFDVLLGPGLAQRICTTLVVTAPRNMMKSMLRNLVVADVEIKNTAHDFQYDSKFQRLVYKHKDKWSMKTKSSHLLELNWVVSHARIENATWKEVVFFSCMTLVVGCICFGCYSLVGRHTDDPLLTLLTNADGILYGFVLELVIEMSFTARKGLGRHEGGVFAGFFHRWWHERTEYGNLYRP